MSEKLKYYPPNKTPIGNQAEDRVLDGCTGFQNSTGIPPVRLRMFNGQGMEHIVNYSEYFAGEITSRALNQAMSGKLNSRQQERLEKVGPDGMTVLDRLKNRFDTNVFETIRREYNLPSTEASERLYKSTLDEANQVVSVTIDTLYPQLHHVLDNNNSVQITSRRPHRQVELMHEEDPLKKRQLIVKNLIALTLAPTVVEKEKNRVSDHLYDIQEALDKYLFEGRKPVVVRSLHDNKTNEVKWVEGVNTIEDLAEQYNDSANVFHQTPQTMRNVVIHAEDELITLEVLTQIRNEKEGVKLFDKAVNDAVELMKNTDPSSDELRADSFTDHQGILFVVKGTNNHEEKKVELFCQELKKVTLEKGINIKAVVEKHKNGGNNDTQAKNIQYKRYIVEYEDGSCIEYVIMSETDFLNNLYEFGNKNEVTGNYEGRSHTIYDQRRALSTDPYLFDVVDNSIPGKVARREVALLTMERVVDGVRQQRSTLPDDLAVKMLSLKDSSQNIIFSQS